MQEAKLLMGDIIDFVCGIRVNFRLSKVLLKIKQSENAAASLNLDEIEELFDVFKQRILN